MFANQRDRVIDWFQRQGQGYHTRMNSALREYIERHRERA
jgi:uncharacterized protein (DUF4415 family)